MKRKRKDDHCITIGCHNPPAPGRKFCIYCGLKGAFIESGKKAVEKGDVSRGLKDTAIGLLIDVVKSYATLEEKPVQIDPMSNYDWIRENATRIASAFSSKVAPPPPMKRDPFLILGLKKTASESDVRKMQQKLATIYHSDVGGDEAATEKMKEINDAASECLKILRSK